MIAALFFVAALQAQDGARVTLAQVVDRALATHPSVGAARAVVDRAGADAADAHSVRMPRVTLDGSLNQFQEPMVVLPLHGFDARNPPLFDRSLVQSGITIGWIAYDFGLRAARARAQDFLTEASRSALTSAERQLVARAVTAYVRVQTARGVLAAHDQRITALDAARTRTRQLVAEGKAARLEQLRVDAEVQRVTAERIASASQLEIAEQDLAQLTSLPVAQVHAAQLPTLSLADSLYSSDTSTATRASLVARASTASSELRELEQRTRAANAGIAAARATAMPELRLSGGYAERGRTRGDFAGEWQLGMGVSYPLYTGGSRQNSTQRAHADEHIATEQLRAARLNIEQSIDRTLATLREARARSGALQLAVDQSAEVVRVERLSLDVGSGTQSEYLDAEAALMRARASLIEAQHAEIVARVELARLVGDLTRDWLARTVEPRQ